MRSLSMKSRKMIVTSFTILLFLALFGCKNDNEGEFMKNRLKATEFASYDCNKRNMEFIAVDMQTFEHYKYYCQTRSPIRVLNYESDIK